MCCLTSFLVLSPGSQKLTLSLNGSWFCDRSQVWNRILERTWMWNGILGRTWVWKGILGRIWVFDVKVAPWRVRGTVMAQDGFPNGN